MRLKLTKKLIDSLQSERGVKVVWDTEIPGFGLKLSPTGLKSFILKYRDLDGRQRKPTIGRYGILTVQEAREQARNWKADLSRGVDPQERKKIARNDITLNEFNVIYKATTAKKRTTLEYEEAIYNKHIREALGRKKLNSIEKKDVQLWFNRLSGKPGGANRTLSLLKAIFNKSIRLEYRNDETNPCLSIKPYSSKPRERFLSKSELKSLWSTMDELEKEGRVSVQITTLIKLALYTGSRKGELLSLKWDYVDLDNRVINLPDSKTGSRQVFLSEQSVELLKELPRLENNEFVFFGGKNGSHIKDPRKQFKKILFSAGIEDFRFHDLRHTHGSWGIMSGLSTKMVSKTLGHRQSRTTERYTHIDSEPAISAVNLISRSLDQAVSE